MSNLTLLYPVRSLDNRLLLPANSVLSAETLDALISSSRTKSYQKHSLFQYGSVREDILNFLSQLSYKVIFSDQKQISNLLKLMESVYLVPPILQSLDYFKKHDFYTYRHILMVFALTTLLAEDLVSDYQDRVKEVASSPTHDIGKACVPIHILKKSNPLTRIELKKLVHHSAAGYVLLSYYLGSTQDFSTIVARDHHERRDGSGYPRGIPLKDRLVEIVAVSDVYDALISPRPYRPTAYDNRTAFEEIIGMAKRNEIEWDIVKALVAHSRKDKPHYSECTISEEKRGTPPPGNVYGVIADEKNQHTDTDDN